MRRIAFCLLGTVLFLVSCSHKQTSTLTERLAWHNEALTKAYDTVGSHNPKWDEPAHKALAEFALTRAGKKSEDATEMGDWVQEAVKDGCDDAMIQYLYCRFAPDLASKPLSARKDAYRKAAQALENSGYSALLKFYANDRAADVLWQDGDRTLWSEISHFRRAAMNDLAVALQDKSMPIEEVDGAFSMLLKTISDNDTEMADAYTQLQGSLFKNWPHTSTAYFIKGKFNYSLAWQARGRGYADTVTPEGWKGFKEKLEAADAAYRKAWSLNSKDARLPTEMIEMAVCQEKDRKEMELWFQRAMELNTNNYTACANKLRYLSPKWYGTREDMIAFGKECVASTKWGGQIPLILAEAHRHYAQLLDKDGKAAYWQTPDVWPDIQASYERFYERNPDADTSMRYPYAWYAFRCGQWQEFKSQIKQIRDSDTSINTGYFGGEDAFSKMVEDANR